MYGRTAYLLALAKPWTPGYYAIHRPATGSSSFDLDADELRSRYVRVAAADAAAPWAEAYEAAAHACLHGAACAAGRDCTIGRREGVVTLLTGSVVRMWDCLERVLRRHEGALPRADRTMRIVRVDLGDGTLPIVGLRYPTHLLPEVVATLATTTTRQDAAGTAPLRRPDDPVTPIDERCMKRAFTYGEKWDGRWSGGGHAWKRNRRNGSPGVLDTGMAFP